MTDSKTPHEEQLTLDPGRSETLKVFDADGNPVDYHVIANPCPPAGTPPAWPDFDSPPPPGPIWVKPNEIPHTAAEEWPHVYAKVIGSTQSGHLGWGPDGLQLATDHYLDLSMLTGASPGMRAHVVPVEASALSGSGIAQRALVVVFDPAD